MSLILEGWMRQINNSRGPKKYNQICEIIVHEEINGNVETFCIDEDFVYKTFTPSANPGFLEKCVQTTKYFPKLGKHVLHEPRDPAVCVYTYFEEKGWYPTVIEFFYKGKLCKEDGYICHNIPSMSQFVYNEKDKCHYLSFVSDKIGLELIEMEEENLWYDTTQYYDFGPYYCKIGNYFTNCIVYDSNDVEGVTLGTIYGVISNYSFNTIRGKNIMYEIEVSLFSAAWYWRRFFDNSIFTKSQFRELLLCFNRKHQKSIILPSDIYFIIKDCLRGSLWVREEIPYFVN